MSDLDSQLHRAGYAAYGWSFWKVTDGDKNGHAIDDENNLVASAKAYVQDQTNKYIATNGQDAWDKLDIREKMRLQVQWGKDEVQNVANTGDLFNGAVLNGNVDQRKGIGQYALSYYGSFDGNTIYTQQDAQKALGVLDDAMERMGITHKPTLKHYVLRLISDDRTFYDVKGLYLKSSSRPYVNKKGVVCFNIHKVDLGDLEIKEGDEFVITAEDGRIILTVI